MRQARPQDAKPVQAEARQTERAANALKMLAAAIREVRQPSAATLLARVALILRDHPVMRPCRVVAPVLPLLLGLTSLGPAEARGEDRLTGAYVNLFAGVAVLDSTVTVPATDTQPGGKFVDQGGDGLFAGLRLGYGALVERQFYVGGEIEGLLLNNVTSRLMAYGVEYRARLRDELGVYGRLGWSPDGRSLIYLRAGLTVPRQVFETAGGAGGEDKWQPSPSAGLGAEFMTSTGWGVRLDATYSAPTGRNRIESYRASFAILYRFLEL